MNFPPSGPLDLMAGETKPASAWLRRPEHAAEDVHHAQNQIPGFSHAMTPLAGVMARPGPARPPSSHVTTSRSPRAGFATQIANPINLSQ